MSWSLSSRPPRRSASTCLCNYSSALTRSCEAASIPLVGLTAWQAVIESANLEKAQKVLIQAGSGGVGTFAIQLVKHVGATVATTTSIANVDLDSSLGADVIVDYKKDDFEKVLRDYDVVVNSLGKETLEKSLRALKPGGSSSRSPVRLIPILRRTSD
jgi:NADPH:quinone reductase-like Zn-dependent oxidoreductase